MTEITGTSSEQLRAIIERVERLEEEKTNIATDIREIYAEAKGNGFDTKTIRQIIKLRKMDKEDRMEQEFLLETYMKALGMIYTDTTESEAEAA